MSSATNSSERTVSRLAKDRVFASGSIILALYLGYQSFAYPVESAFFPRVLSVLLGFLALLLFVRISVKIRKDRARENASWEKSSFSSEFRAIRSAGMVFVSIVVYGVLLMLVNYEVASVTYLVAMMLLFGFKRPLAICGIAAGLTLLLYVVFFHLLGVSRPESLFFM